MTDGLKPPAYMSLPRAAAFPVGKLDFSYTAKKRLLKHGIVSALQLAEIASRQPHLLKELTGISAAKALRVLEAALGILPDFTNRAVSFDPLPAEGVPIAPPVASAPVQTSSTDLGKHLSTLAPLPKRVDLSKQMQPVGNQGIHPTCVGWASSAAFEYKLGGPMSPGYAYRAAKSRDGWKGAGSWQRFAFEHFYLTGHVDEAHYPYASAIREDPIEFLSDIASKARTSGFARLPVSERAVLPKLLKSLLAGQFSPTLAPRPVAISVALYPSFTMTSTALDGLIPLPFPGETPRSGHAMVVVGYSDAADPENPFGIDYFIVRNSWGTSWAGENPFGLPGHALMPTRYFQKENAISEAIICLT